MLELTGFTHFTTVRILFVCSKRRKPPRFLKELLGIGISEGTASNLQQNLDYFGKNLFNLVLCVEKQSEEYSIKGY